MCIGRPRGIKRYRIFFLPELIFFANKYILPKTLAMDFKALSGTNTDRRVTEKRHERQLLAFEKAKHKIASDNMYGETPWPDGLYLLPDFLLQKEEADLLAYINQAILPYAKETDFGHEAIVSPSQMDNILLTGKFKVILQADKIVVRKYSKNILSQKGVALSKTGSNSAIAVLVLNADSKAYFSENIKEQVLADTFTLHPKQRSLLVIKGHTLNNFEYAYGHSLKKGAECITITYVKKS